MILIISQCHCSAQIEQMAGLKSSGKMKNIRDYIQSKINRTTTNIAQLSPAQDGRTSRSMSLTIIEIISSHTARIVITKNQSYLLNLSVQGFLTQLLENLNQVRKYKKQVVYRNIQLVYIEFLSEEQRSCRRIARIYLGYHPITSV